MTRLRSRSITSTRSTTLLIAFLSLTSNILSSIFVHQLPDDPFHLATNYGMYLHFANVMSVFGVIGGLRRHALSILCFSTYLLLDTLLSTIPRLLLLTLLSNSSSILCAPSSTTSLDFTTQIPSNINSQELSLATYSISSHIPASSHVAGFADFMGKTGGEDGWSEKGCKRVMYLGYVTLMGGVMVAMGLQVLGALCVRDYARGLFLAERNELESGDGEWERRIKEGSEERREKVIMVDREGFRPLLVLDREEEEQFRRMTPISEERDFS
ncbi:128dd651-2ed3-4341-8248-d2037de41997 [Sclerotinia trifoliorum]|uniref:128dd651-2ed3-4341-8248-d2037de41997 n=1 Tax=Sclerotinia trifoliorum TaxID=28548 RepID=A0A8H2ZPU0_9HELO|nr:128dd651-2ed3-4341-8248-d2037de41997 [Sclerotinia trifoliorum]